MNKFLTYFVFFSLLYVSCASAQVVLIDPGHGGEDCGAMAYQKYKKQKKVQVICEKDIALIIAKKVQKYLRPDFNAYLTRTIDSTVGLEKRANMADKIRADIFISIHLNSSKMKNGQGYETFYLSNHNDKAVKKIEQVENKNAKGEQAIINKILADLVIDRVAPQSKRLATLLHKEISKNIKKKYKLTDRGIKPALFYVLALSKRPSVLLEAGFVSNEREIKKILNNDFQNKYALAVANGIRRYFKKNKGFPFF
ncbi:MAG: N-acetylmuramoyl-L-alanine amidase [Bacteriovoracaceae bacterium]|nr:N-acetylmuramoyl-L-alanine amidase [Bacteriovoracaceae bacterium]